MCRCDGRSTDAGSRSHVAHPHSRLNDLDPAALSARDYRVLSASPKVGADIFVKRLGSLFVFLQGHPEYDSESLLREYRRDVTRFLRGERPDFPAFPENYFDASLEGRLSSFAERVADGRSRQPHGELTSCLMVSIRPGLGARRPPGCIAIGWTDSRHARRHVQPVIVRMPSMTNCAARAASITPSIRPSTSVPVVPKTRATCSEIRNTM